MSCYTPLSFPQRRRPIYPCLSQPDPQALLLYAPATARVKALTSFPQFSALPKELQLQIWSAAFFITPALHDWIRIDWKDAEAVETYYFNESNPKTDFWNWSRARAFPKSVGLRTADRRLHLLISFDSGIPSLLQACRLSRFKALEDFRDLLKETGFVINLTALTTNTAVFEELLEDMKKGDSKATPHNTFSSRPVPLLQRRPQSLEPAPLLVNIHTAPRRFHLIRKLQ